MDGTVDPSTTLRQKSLEILGHKSLASRCWYKQHFTMWECTKHDGG